MKINLVMNSFKKYFTELVLLVILVVMVFIYLYLYNKTSLLNISYASQVISSFSFIVIVWQSFIYIKDAKMRSRREAGVLSMQQAEKYANEILPKSTEINKILRENKINLKVKNELIKGEALKDFKKSEDFKLIKIALSSKREVIKEIKSLLNKLEAMSMVMISGISDESIVFSSLCPTFIEIFEEYNLIISLTREGTVHNKPYQNIIDLYTLWKDRSEKDKLNFDLNKILTNLEKIPNSKVKIIGN